MEVGMKKMTQFVFWGVALMSMVGMGAMTYAEVGCIDVETQEIKWTDLEKGETAVKACKKFGKRFVPLYR
jgi:hypothetical protein